MKFNKKLTETATVKLYDNTAPKIVFAHDVMNKMQELVEQSSIEVGWLCEVEKADKNNYYVSAIHIPTQKAHASTTEIETEGLLEITNELLALEDGMERINNIRLWGHSHVNMTPAPSGQDQQQMKLFVDNGCDYFFRLICNKQGIMKIDFFNYKDGLVYSDINYEIGYPKEIAALYEQIDALYDEIDKKEASYVGVYKEEIASTLKQKVQRIGYSFKGSNPYLPYGGYNNGYANPYQKKNLTSETKSVENNKLKFNGKLYPKDFNDLNLFFTEDEVLFLAATPDTNKALALIHQRIPGASDALSKVIFSTAEDYYDEVMLDVAQKQVWKGYGIN